MGKSPPCSFLVVYGQICPPKASSKGSSEEEALQGLPEKSSTFCTMTTCCFVSTDSPCCHETVHLPLQTESHES